MEGGVGERWEGGVGERWEGGVGERGVGERGKKEVEGSPKQPKEAICTGHKDGWITCFSVDPGTVTDGSYHASC